MRVPFLLGYMNSAIRKSLGSIEGAVEMQSYTDLFEALGEIKECRDELEAIWTDPETLIKFTVVPQECPQCHQLFDDESNLKCIKAFGECLSCDHVRADQLDDVIAEARSAIANEGRD